MIKVRLCFAILIFGAFLSINAQEIKVKSAADYLSQLLSNNKTNLAWEEFNKLKNGETTEYQMIETEFNSAGYKLFGQGEFEKANELFKMGTEAFPESSNAFDSYAESLLALGKKELAIKFYKKAIELNDKNFNALMVLEQIDMYYFDFQNETEVKEKFKAGEQTGIKGEYFGQKCPGKTSTVFAPGIISVKGGFEFSSTFSPDGKEFYFTRSGDIFVSNLKEEGWTQPKLAWFSSPQLDHEPFITPDGKYLVFGSARPRETKDRSPYGIYLMRKTKKGWSEPEFICRGMFATISNKGHLFVTDIFDLHGKGIVRYDFKDGKVSNPVNLTDGKTFLKSDAHPVISPDEDFILYDGNRDNEEGYFVSFKLHDGSWSKYFNLNEKINSKGIKMCMNITPDGKYLMYHVKRDIHWISSSILDDYKKELGL